MLWRGLDLRKGWRIARVTGIVVAAGSGRRLGTGQPKGLVALAGEALLVHAARALGGACDALVVVVGEPQRDQAAEALTHAGLDAVVAAGGATRADSVAAGLAACDQQSAVVAVHDAARALASAALVSRTLAAVSGWDGAAPALPVVDSLKLADPGGEHAVVRTLERRDLWAVQTPQVFPFATLLRVHSRLDRAAATDDLELVERDGGRVHLVAGERRAFKITYPEDLVLAEALLAADR